MDRQYSYAASEPSPDIDHALAKLRESRAGPWVGGGGLGSDPPHGPTGQEDRFRRDNFRRPDGRDGGRTSNEQAAQGSIQRRDEVSRFGHSTSAYVRRQNGHTSTDGAPKIARKVVARFANQRISSITLEFALMVCICALVSSVVSSVVVDRAIHVQPAMVFRDLMVVNTPVPHGEPAMVSYSYDKRADCYPPKGDGDFYYRVYTQDPDGQFRNFYRLERGMNSQEPPGDGLKAINAVWLPDLPPGKYALAFRAVFKCAGEKEEQLINTDKMPLTIVK